MPATLEEIADQLIAEFLNRCDGSKNWENSRG
jgi:hypothetical protein